MTNAELVTSEFKYDETNSLVYTDKPFQVICRVNRTYDATMIGNLIAKLLNEHFDKGEEDNV